jgi:hypothetical protein
MNEEEEEKTEIHKSGFEVRKLDLLGTMSAA